MFAQLARYRTIFVTGPQRSGTTIAGRMIAADLFREYIDERDFGAHDLHNLLHVCSEESAIQGPALSAYCHLLPEHVAVVFMQRDVAEIVASQDRTRLPSGKTWTDEEEAVELRKYFRAIGPIAAVKYDVWERYQKPIMQQLGRPFFELEYASLSEHPLWVPKENRQGWLPKQTSQEPPQRKKRAPWKLR